MLGPDQFQPPKGHFLLKVYRGLDCILEVDEPNLIVNGSKAIHAHLLGGDVTGRSITQIGFGTNGSVAAPTDTALVGAYTKGFDLITYPVAGQVKFEFTLGTGEANGTVIREFGLLTASGALYSRKVRVVPMLKASDISFQGSWIIKF